MYAEPNRSNKLRVALGASLAVHVALLWGWPAPSGEYLRAAPRSIEIRLSPGPGRRAGAPETVAPSADRISTAAAPAATPRLPVEPAPHFTVMALAPDPVADSAPATGPQPSAAAPVEIEPRHTTRRGTRPRPVRHAKARQTDVRSATPKEKLAAAERIPMVAARAPTATPGGPEKRVSHSQTRPKPVRVAATATADPPRREQVSRAPAAGVPPAAGPLVARPTIDLVLAGAAATVAEQNGVDAIGGGRPAKDSPAPDLARLSSLLHEQIARHQRYPILARRQRREGVTMVRFELFPNGELQAVNLVGTSGFKALDTAAMRAVKSVSPFAGARNYLSKAREFSVNVVFRLR